MKLPSFDAFHDKKFFRSKTGQYCYAAYWNDVLNPLSPSETLFNRSKIISLGIPGRLRPLAEVPSTTVLYITNCTPMKDLSQFLKVQGISTKILKQH